jgi:protein-disulfide isomerase
MKNVILTIVVIALVVGAFFAGRVTADKPLLNKSAAEVAQGQQAPAPAPAAQAPAAQAQRPQMAEPPAGSQVFPTSPMSDKAVARQIDIPPGTKPARDVSPFRGPKDAPVVFMVISDFQCPVCKRAHEGLASLSQDFPDKVRYVFKHNPLEMHKDSLNAAAASLAAGRQGRFWEYADALFANQRGLSESDLMEVASRLKLDMARFKKDYEDPSLRQRAKTEGAIAQEIGARGTPAFMVNGKLQVGWASYAAVKQQVENEVAAIEALTSKGMGLKKAREERVRANLPDMADKLLNTPLGIELTEF